MTTLRNYILHHKTKAATLAAFRVLFGVLMLGSLIRFVAMDWVAKFYILPKWHFTYYGFGWVKTLGIYTYGLFAVAMMACVGIIVGYKYRIFMILFFLSFTYIELIDKTTYLNHYYFVSVMSFLLIFLPLHATFSIDAKNKGIDYKYVPSWTVDSIKLILGIVYFYAGLAKLNSDWLLRAQPLKIWLSTKTDMPIIGSFMNQSWFHYTMSWSGMLYDLSIPFLLLIRKTRPFAFVAVVVFHVFTRILFDIGMFPYIMICLTLVFFDSSLHEKFLLGLKKAFKINDLDSNTTVELYSFKRIKNILFIISLFIVIQLFLPFRNLCYPGELFWTEQGFRFSWRVMLMEKVGYTNFIVKDSVSGKQFHVKNSDFLTSFQIKQMSFQPDFILEYAHLLGDHFKSQGHQNIQVFVESYVALNGRLNQLFIDPKVDLYKQEEGFHNKTWILPLNDEIKGF
ncbi:HTTM domain-containing protein [Wenyingzhuangia marina]|uniref:Vitamin K-dependent gamma-carboxylase n=1 Tax=Wenyingzhuangia marina TaxID=1195760 RepID=A0A1M5TWV7_9FLAO|nr:HTTM domain-containing protein [Wenyingzhuangia marina]GGF70655.1 type I deoxyribonuclease HsdR [Wenyingzhuangia marina]SHH55184.1 Vitamin K-dependent gamma-carboxylase [Wenyingzhuangia marina]